MKIDIYDCDKTIIPFDSGVKFISFCIKRYPMQLYPLLPQFAKGGFGLATKSKNLKEVKKYFFSFVDKIPLDVAVKDFWDKYEDRVFDWVLKPNRRHYSVLISAGPDFLIREIARRLEFDDCICTQHDLKTGEVIGNNVHDAEKIRLFREKYPDAQVADVYSDSLRNDKYIFSLGNRCYNTIRGRRILFDYHAEYKEEQDKERAKQ